MKKEKVLPSVWKRNWIRESILIIILVVLTSFMLINVNNIQGSARVVNYAGIVRGATQRLVKLELSGKPNDELIEYLNDILEGLENGGGEYGLIRLGSEEYHKNLHNVILYWKDLQREIYTARQMGPENTDLLEMSETYFTMADTLVGSAESFSQENATSISRLELCVIVDILLIVFILIHQSLKAVNLGKSNKELNKTAYIDVHTGLPNKSKCEQVLSPAGYLKTSTCCMMFDLNGLKQVNDTLGHIAGDTLILNFSRILRCVIPEKDFLGRYGGDEFVAVITDTTKEEIERLIRKIQEEITGFNSSSKQPPISFACGYAISSDYEECTMQILLGKADYNMYLNKRKMKEGSVQ